MRTLDFSLLNQSAGGRCAATPTSNETVAAPDAGKPRAAA